MNKNNIFDFLENSEDGDLEMIYRLTPELSDEQFERILTMSKKRRNIMKKSNERNIKMIQKNPDTVSGVDIYKRPSWTRILATAASFVILAGGLAFGFHLMRKSDSPAPPLSSDAQSTSNTSTTTSIVTTSTQPAEDTYRAECEKAMNEIERNMDEAYELIAHISDHIDMNDTFEVNVEMSPEHFTDKVSDVLKMEKSLANAMKIMLGINPTVHLVAAKSIVRSEGKAVRVIDKRKLHD